MAYNSLALNLLISAPSDIPKDDLAVISRTILQWNAVVGRAFAVTVVPISWTEHAVSQFGNRPQAFINSQLVDSADLGLALFNRRLGTPTGAAESGTAEEIVTMAEAGKPVSILRNQMSQGPLEGESAAEELVRLESFLRREIFSKALVLSYTDHAELVQHVNNMLSAHTSSIRQRVEDAVSDLPDETLGVWPRIESSESMEQDSKGRLKTRRRWSLVLENKTGKPVYDVTYKYINDGNSFDLSGGQSEPVSVLAPNASVQYPVFFSLGSAAQANCVVTWHDSNGKEYNTEATVRR